MPAWHGTMRCDALRIFIQNRQQGASPNFQPQPTTVPWDPSQPRPEDAEELLNELRTWPDDCSWWKEEYRPQWIAKGPEGRKRCRECPGDHLNNACGLQLCHPGNGCCKTPHRPCMHEWPEIQCA